MPSVLIQTGHVAPREPGFEAGTGAAGEQEMVKLIAADLQKIIAADNRFVCRVIPGKIPSDVRSGAYKVDAFISLHCDGSQDSRRRGWGIGYPGDKVNKRLSDLVGAEMKKIHPSARLTDNYTTNMSGYYGWSRVPTPGPEILVEHGFVSNPNEKKWMQENSAKIARAEYLGLLKFFDLPEKPRAAVGTWITPEEARASWKPGDPIWQNLPGPKGKPAWVWQLRIEEARREAVLAALEDA